MAAADEQEERLKAALQSALEDEEHLTAADGPFPLAEEAVEHFGTVQRYRCWQRGPNSIVHLTLPELFGDCFTRFGDQEFLIYEEERLTFSQVLESSVALSRTLQLKYSVCRGACVAVAGRNYPEWVIAFLAVSGHLNAVTLPVNAWWTGDELKYGLRDSQTCLLIADLERLQRAPFLDEMGIPAICMRGSKSSLPGRAAHFEEAVAFGRTQKPLRPMPVNQDDRSMLMYTSGTTGMPKGVVMTHRNICSALNMVRLWDYSEEPKQQRTVLLASPLFHVNGTHVALLAAICKGERLVLMYKWDAKRALELIQAEKIYNIVGVPTNTYDLVNHPDFLKYDTSTMLAVGGGGAAFAAPMIKRVSDTFKNAKAGTGYGLTETDAISVVMASQFFPLRPTSCGRPVANVDVCILGEKNQKLPAGEVGEICIRGATVMKEYWQKPDKTAEVFHVDEEGKLWFRSGDIGALDAQQFVYIMDRAKDIIIRGGENISCAEIEGALFEHPAVAEVAAIGVPNENLGETVAVAIVFKQGQAPKAEELKRHAASRLAAHKVPAEIFVWHGAALPRGATGKIQKREIRENLADMRKGKKGVPTSKL
eukprot:TRINITY_DN29847_c0_g1_i1.p1 TRINITY_DN29847_c0_g1~~TRINITY_DN29847_c0_g1_i1.p1  ORF type:complete len:594 (+),score=135.83 TRINITY_DN29847_c0_g1_i1:50-1831(+)